MNRREALAGIGATGSALLAGRPALLSAEGGDPALRIVTGQLTQGGWARGFAAPGLALAFRGDPVPTDPRGDFLVAFDRDADGAAIITGRDSRGRSHELPLTISPRAWKIERVPVGPRPGAEPSEAFRIRREGELARINAARSMETGAGGWKQEFIWPAKGRISGRFGSQRIYNGTPGSYHTGLDIATGTSGTPFVAPADGTVILAADRQFSLEGNLLMLDHGMNLNSAFLHCSKLLVGMGETVKKGQVIGHIGATGRATGPHLHWSIKWRDARLDPLLFLPA
jgi:hypothetical protein